MLLTTTLLTIVSCKKDDPSTLNVSMENVVIGAEGGKQNVAVTSNTSWSVSGASNWCSVYPINGNGNSSFEINVEKNNSDQRECVLIVQTNDGKVSKLIKVVQNSLVVNLTVNPSKIKFGSGKDDKKTLQITCNTEWTITNLPDWLDADQLAGNGDRSITFTTKSDNATSSLRTNTITITAGTNSVNVELSQEAGLSSCYVLPKGIVSLCDAVAFLSEKHGNVKNYRAGYIRASDYNKYSYKELLEITRKFDAITEFDVVESIIDLYASTDYYLLTLAYDTDDQEGELIKTAFTTKPDDYSQSLVTIGKEKFYTSNNEIIWYATPDGSTDKYYTMFLCGLSEADLSNLLYTYEGNLYYDTVKLAWYLDNEINNGSENYKVKKGEAEIVESSGYALQNDRVVKRGNAFQLGYSVFFTWGVNISNNKLSGLASASGMYVEYSSVTKKNEIRQLNKFNGKKVVCRK